MYYKYNISLLQDIQGHNLSVLQIERFGWLLLCPHHWASGVLSFTHIHMRGCRGHDRMVVGFTTYLCNQCLSPLKVWVEPRSWQGELDTTLCDKVCQWFVTGGWFSLGTPVSSTDKTDCHDITEILLKMALNTINQSNRILMYVRLDFGFSSIT
jgi:hypothetical protein